MTGLSFCRAAVATMALVVVTAAVGARPSVAQGGAPGVPTDRARFHLFLLAGQSNMAGRGKVEPQDTRPIPRVLMLDRQGVWVPAVDPMHYDKPVAGVGLGRSFAAALTAADPDVTIGLIPVAAGGSPIDTWTPGGYHDQTKSHPWDDAIARARVAMGAGTLKGILWHQGESDATPALAAGYAAKLTDLVARFRSTLGAPDVPFIVGQLGQFPDVPWDDDRRLVDAAHRSLTARVARTAYVPADQLTHGGDRIHFDSASLRELGRRYATAYQALTSGTSANSDVLPAGVRAAGDAITAAGLARDLEFLASDALRGRDTGSPGFTAAAAAIEARLRAAGLTPAGDQGTYRQHYDLRELRADADRVALIVGGRRFTLGDIALRSLAGAVDGDAPVIYVGHGWYAPERGLNPYAGLDVRGALLLAHGPRATPPGGDVTQVGRVTVGASSVVAEAKRRGARGVLWLTSSQPTDDWEALRSANLVRRELDPPVPSAYAAPAVTGVLLGTAARDALLEGEAISGADLVARGQATTYPRSFKLRKRVRLEVPIAGVATERPFNVVALLEGTDPAATREAITVAAHLDGAVGTRTVEGDAIYNSADDNASGSAALLAIAEQLARAPRPRRSIVFLWDSGEERGLWGTRQFVHRPPVPLARIAAHVNVDMIGATRAPGTSDAASEGVTGPNAVFLIGPGVLSPTADALISRVNDAYMRMTFDRRDDRADSEFFYPRTDAGPYLERGILTIGFTTGTHSRYHLPADEARHLDPEKMQAVARTVLASVWALADTPVRPRIERPIPPSVPNHAPLPVPSSPD